MRSALSLAAGLLALATLTFQAHRCAAVQGSLSFFADALPGVLPGVFTLQSGALTVTVGVNGSYSLQVGSEPGAVSGAPLSAYVGGAERTVANGGMVCADAERSSGDDKWGSFSGAELQCKAGGVDVVYSWHAYNTADSHLATGKILCSLQLPQGANGTAAQALFSTSNLSPVQFAPFPAWRIEGALSSASVLCYGGDKAHLYSMPSFTSPVKGGCFSLGNGPATTIWPGGTLPGGLHALVSGPASSFHLNYNRLIDLNKPPPTTRKAVLYYNAKRGDATLCLTAGCAQTQVASGYTVISADEGLSAAECDAPACVLMCPSMDTCCCPASGADYQPLYFSWSPTHQDNWVSNSSSCPGPSYTNCGNADGAVYRRSSPGRIPLVSYVNSKRTHHIAAATAKSQTWAEGLGYVSEGILGYLEAPKPGPPPPPTPPKPHAKVWGFGVSGDVTSVPPGFTQDTLLVHSSLGPTAAWDEWGSSIRKAYNTTKKADEDVFLTSLTIWTDNGAATLGPAWHADTGTKPPPYTKLGPNVSFMNWNWSMVSTEVLGNVADGVRATGVAPRGTQLDCWWYPVDTVNHPFWCVSDWVLPEEFYPSGTGGVRKRMGVPLMLYGPALCLDNVWNQGGKYTWASGTRSQNFLLPVAEQSEMFWGDMFDYGAAMAAKSVDPGAEAWPTWAPPMVKAAWKGTNLAAYETDFYHNIVTSTPQLRQQYGAGEMFLDGIHRACEARNMTAQLCAGNPPSFLEALTMPTVTNARASIDYDWDGDPGAGAAKNGGPRSNNGAHNWAAPDNGWVFWASRIAPSKDNFWSSNRDLSSYGYGKDSGRNGMDAELHAINALLLTGPVGLGDTCIGTDCMTNKTLVTRLARADGTLLRPDKPLAPLDVQFASLLGNANGTRAMPGLCTPAQEAQGPTAKCGARLWQTHSTVAVEDASRAPELATAPTRRLVSHSGVDATAQATVPAALADNTGKYLLQYLVVSVDQPDHFMVQMSDLYPLPISSGGSIPAKVAFIRPATIEGETKCTAGKDAMASGCVSIVPSLSPTGMLVSKHCDTLRYLAFSKSMLVLAFVVRERSS